jgi:hypothetical protein
MTVSNKPAASVDTLFFDFVSEFYASNIFVCSIGVADNFFLGIIPAGETDISWLYHSLPLKVNETFVVTALSFSRGDKLYVKSTAGFVRFTMTGSMV